MLAWVDLETTGLDPVDDDVLEIYCIVTDDSLNEVARFHRVVHSSREFSSLSSVVQDMHLSNGLWKEVKAISSVHRSAADNDFAAFLREHAKGAPLAGSTIGFDREFMRVHLPQSLAAVHYRSLDVTSLNEVARRFWPGLYENRPVNKEKAHRAMDDIEESLRVARHYIAGLGPV